MIIYNAILLNGKQIVIKKKDDKFISYRYFTDEEYETGIKVFGQYEWFEKKVSKEVNGLDVKRFAIVDGTLVKLDQLFKSENQQDKMKQLIGMKKRGRR